MNGSGIYSITNTITGRVYIGQAVNIAVRWSGHRGALRGGRHSNTGLQADWHTHGAAAFSFAVIEQCTRAELTEREYLWIQDYQDRPAGVYNARVRSRAEEEAARPEERRRAWVREGLTRTVRVLAAAERVLAAAPATPALPDATSWATLRDDLGVLAGAFEAMKRREPPNDWEPSEDALDGLAAG
jgi:hypothetical protein